ncbi:hypothetical protein BH789_gp108 [Gordonia phage GMA6]|uniref:Uncharacterized protein n=1 Tax=Gordonia phage GMA6 TaxID=1647285 RepID=A0A0K0NLA9_9CAUD|nr:hypothetical protein BH789_gp108 [Gordonia phage GMA6]AKL88389.1 hypothetical protein GMA6_108 [Gordonia phage GMA6]
MTNPAPLVPKKINRKTGKPVSRRSGQERYPWDKIRRDYIEGVPVPGTKDERVWPNLKDLGEDYGVPYPRMRKRSAAERWTAHKEAAQNVARLARMKKRAEQIETNALDFDEKSYNVAKLGMSLVAGRMAEIGQEMQVKKQFRDQAIADLQSGLPVPKEDLYSSIRYQELEGLAGAAERFQSIGMKALGTDSQRIDINNIGGGDTNVSIVNVSNELARDDAERLGDVFAAMNEAGLLPKEVLDAVTIVDAEVEENDIPSDLADAQQEAIEATAHTETEEGEADGEEDDGDEDWEDEEGMDTDAE